jgi:hypothetical protein
VARAGLGGDHGRDHDRDASRAPPNRAWPASAPGSGVFTGPNPDSDAVIRTGDTIGGKTVQFVKACREMLNIRGQVAVKVTFEDSTETIIRATPRP